MLSSRRRKQWYRKKEALDCYA